MLAVVAVVTQGLELDLVARVARVAVALEIPNLVVAERLTQAVAVVQIQVLLLEHALAVVAAQA